MNNKPFTILSPIDGDMLNEYDGGLKGNLLEIPVKIASTEGQNISVNGIAAMFDGQQYCAVIPLNSYCNSIEVIDESTGYLERIAVYWLRNATGKYRLSLDDNIWFLRDIAFNCDIYKSIFENPYLGFLKSIHDEFDTKIHINIYYQTDGFNLSQMPSKYKSEWRSCSDWLKLTFHALQNDPDKLYMNATYDIVKRDYEMVTEQIIRFAGYELISPVTTLHWGEATIEGCKALRDQGVKALMGDFMLIDSKPAVSYYLDPETAQHLAVRSLWKDNKLDMIFEKCSIVINVHEPENIGPFMNKLIENPYRRGYLDLCIHEQYFYPFYKDYQPNYKEKVTTTIKWASENGYKPAFLSECIFK